MDAGIEGAVSMKLLIGKDGNVLDMIVESASNSLFVKSLQQSVKKWKFTPAINMGVPVRVLMRQKIFSN